MEQSLGTGYIYRFILQLLLQRWNLLPRQPSPPRQFPTGGMIHPEIISIAHTRYLAKQTPFPEERRRNAVGVREAAKVAAVEAHEGQNRPRQDECRNEGPWFLERGPIG